MKVTVAEFDYTKANGDTTHRRVLILSKPSDSYFGVELETDHDLDTYTAYMLEREEMDNELKAKHGIADTGFKYRRFKETGITFLNEEKYEF